MRAVLILPDLLATRADATPIRAPYLARLLAQANAARRDADGFDASLAAHYGVVRQTDWPLAAVRVAALGIEPGGDYWLAADPVALDVGRDDAVFAGNIGDLARADVDSLVATLNAHFADDAITFVAPRPDAMFARMPTPPRIATHPPGSGRDEPLRRRLPEGPDAGTWRRWQSEIQMLLHEHPVNVRRESLGQTNANTVWFSSGGTMPLRPVTAPSIDTYANAGIAVALAQYAGRPARRVPPTLADVLDGAVDAALKVVALDPGIPLAEIDEAWLAPAWKALVAGRLTDVTLLTDDAGDAVQWHATRPDLWRRVVDRLQRRDAAALIDAARRPA